MPKVIADITILSKQYKLRIKHAIFDFLEVNLLKPKIIYSHNLFHVMTVSKWLTNLAYVNFIKFSVTSPATGSSVLKWGLCTV